MKSGIVNLDVLVEYAKNDDPMGMSLRASSPSGRKFGELAKGVSTSILDEQGFYLWGTYKTNGL